MWALQCGCASRREFYRRLTWRELRELEIAYGIEPWGETRADLRAGIVASAAVAPHCKRGQQPRPIDFMPYMQEDVRKPKKSLAQMKAIAAMAAAGFDTAAREAKQNG